jgi:hypothetical protein
MGKVRKAMNYVDSLVGRVLLTELFARAIKNDIRENLRNKMKIEKKATEEPFKEVIFSYLSNVTYRKLKMPTTLTLVDKIYNTNSIQPTTNFPTTNIEFDKESYISINSEKDVVYKYNYVISDPNNSMQSLFIEIKFPTILDESQTFILTINSKQKTSSISLEFSKNQFLVRGVNTNNRSIQKTISDIVVNDCLGIFISTQILITHNQRVAHAFEAEQFQPMVLFCSYSSSY